VDAAVSDRKAKRVTTRTHTAAKRVAFNAIYDDLVDEIDPIMFSDPRTDRKAGWKAVCAHRYCTRDISDGRTRSLIENATRKWLTAMRETHFNTPAHIERRRAITEREEREAREARARVETEERDRRELEERLAREARIRQQAEEAAANMPRLVAADDVRHALDRPLVVPVPPGALMFAGGQWQRMPPERVAEMLRGLSAEMLNNALQDLSPVAVSRIFEIMGLGQSGEMCSVCMEPKRSWSKFTKNCAHAFCHDCAIAWAKSNTVPDGLGCPFCVKDGVPKEKCIADPFTMFAQSVLQGTPSLIPFSAAQIPMLQVAVDAEVAGLVGAISSSSTKSGRCPGCSTVSAHGNNFIRRCHNPICAAEFCLRCNFLVDPAESHTRHTDGTCMKIAEEANALVNGEGLAPCPKCGSQIWHAVGHACHAVKCPVCALKFCHACGTPYDQNGDHVAQCRCPIFCGEGFACRCAKTCPECAIKRCEHCNGSCPSCKSKEAAPASV
jgi:hypothetical protein